MSYKVLCFLLGFILVLIGNLYVFLYLSLLSIGYSFFRYLTFILSHFPGILIYVGTFLIFVAMYKGGNNDIYL